MKLLFLSLLLVSPVWAQTAFDDLGPANITVKGTVLTSGATVDRVTRHHGGAEGNSYQETKRMQLQVELTLSDNADPAKVEACFVEQSLTVKKVVLAGTADAPTGAGKFFFAQSKANKVNVSPTAPNGACPGVGRSSAGLSESSAMVR